MKKKYDEKYKSMIITIFPGELYVSRGEEVITTLLGSCVSVCICDKQNKVYGMNHFMLPKNKEKDSISDILDKSRRRYGPVAMKTLVRKMVRKGAVISNMKAKIFGGGSVMNQMISESSLGVRNINYAKKFLKEHNIEIISEDTSNTHGRKLMFFTNTCSVYVKELAADQRVYHNNKSIINMNSFALGKILI